MQLIDVTDWPRIEDKSVDGTQDKYVVQHPDTGEEYIIKLPLKAGDNEIITEWMATELLGKAWGFNVQDCEPLSLLNSLISKRRFK
jgi:hypothetical protein